MPWAKPRYELPLLGLVAFAALSSVYVVSTQDTTRLCLTQAVLRGHLTVHPCAGDTIDQASYAGHRYTDKAPGLSFLATPVVWATRLPTASQWESGGDLHLWLVRLATCGLGFMALVFLVGRISEGIAPGFGGAALVAFSLGTYVAPLAATTFDHVLAAALVFGGFVLAWSRRYFLAGLVAGAAVCTNYLCALIGVVVAAYILATGLRPLLRFAAGAAPPLILLGAYDWAAFGSPLHLSYRYVANQYARQQASGFFGLHPPNAHGIDQVFLADRGILIASPVLVAAAAGVVLLARRHRLEAIVCGAVFGLFALANCGYFDPYGGISPGPRFLIPALPFLALGLAPAFFRWFRTTAALAAISIVAMTALTLTWAKTQGIPFRQTIWGELARVLVHGQRSLFVHGLLTKNIVDWVGINRIDATGLTCLCAATAYALALLASRGLHQRLPVPRVRSPLAAPDQRQPAERDVLDEREDVALEG